MFTLVNCVRPAWFFRVWLSNSDVDFIDQDVDSIHAKGIQKTYVEIYTRMCLNVLQCRRWESELRLPAAILCLISSPIPNFSIKHLTSQRWTDQGPTSANTASRVAPTNWRPAEDVGSHYQGRPGAPLRTTSLWLRTMEKGQGESLLWACAGPLSLQCRSK